jgi:integrase/recombinase XerC
MTHPDPEIEHAGPMDPEQLPGPVLPPSRSLDTAAVLAAWRAGKKPITLASYLHDLGDFANWCACSPEEAAGRFLALDAGRAHEVALGYIEHLQARELASATVNRRLSALRSLVRAARMVGMVTWNLELPAPKTVPYRDTRGPGPDGVQALIAQAELQPEPLRSRNLALIWLLYGRALRRSEACGIQVPDDLDLARKRIKILGKHRHDPEWVTIPPASLRALEAWLQMRGEAPGPLFYRLDLGASGDQASDHLPLTGRGVLHIISSLGKAAGLTIRPHGLRHAAITGVLDLTGGNHRKAQRFGRLRKADILNYYDDNRDDVGGEAAGELAP